MWGIVLVYNFSNRGAIFRKDTEKTLSTFSKRLWERSLKSETFMILYVCTRICILKSLKLKVKKENFDNVSANFDNVSVNVLDSIYQCLKIWFLYNKS